MPNFLKGKTLKYLNRDYDAFVKDLVKYSQAHHSGVFTEFNESSPGMALIGYAAYVGDVLSFYQDQAFNELKMGVARQEKNVIEFAKSLGYKPKGNRAALGKVHFILEVPASTNDRGDTVPDEMFCPVLLRGSKAGGPNGAVFETLEDIHFSSSFERDVTGSQFDQSTGLPTHFAIRKPVDVIGAETKEETFTVGDFEPFKTIELSDDDVIEILSVVDSDGNEWVEVEYLAQDTVYSTSVNNDEDNDSVPYVLKLIPVPRRFIKDRDSITKKTKLVFGSGDGVDFDDELVPNLADLALPIYGKKNFNSFCLDPQNFLKTRSLGLSPFNTSLTVTYRAGGGTNTNVPAKSIRDVVEANFSFGSTNLDPLKKSSVEGSVECINLEKTLFGAPPETISEIKANSAAFFAAQDRVVTREDYEVRIKTLPEKFGKPDKVFVRKNNFNNLSMDIHVLSKDENGHLQRATPTLKKNIKTYLSKYRMMTDGVNILDSDVINLKVNFGIVVGSKFNRSEILTKVMSLVKDYFDIDVRQMGEPVVISDLSADIQDILGVISVYDLRVTNMFGVSNGREYSNVRFDVNANTTNNIIYCPENSIFEIKFPERDIVGVAK